MHQVNAIQNNRCMTLTYKKLMTNDNVEIGVFDFNPASRVLGYGVADFGLDFLSVTQHF